MTESSSNGLPDRVESLEVNMLDVKVSLNRLVDITFDNGRYLQNTMQAVDRLASVMQQLAETQAETIARIDGMQADVREMQSEVRGLQTENRRIWQVISDRLGLE